jgi:hypothetical protein
MKEKPFRPHLSISLMCAKGSSGSGPEPSALPWDEPTRESRGCERGSAESGCCEGPSGLDPAPTFIVDCAAFSVRCCRGLEETK